MTAKPPVTCDCLNMCGDDSWLRDGSGRSTPCRHYAAELAEKKRLAEQSARVGQLMAHYAAETVYGLIEKLHAEVTSLKTGPAS